MVRRLAIVIVLALLAAGGAQGYGGSERQAELNGKIARLQDRIAAANQREAVLTSEISSVTAKIRSLQGDVDDASTRVAVLERELALYERRLDALTELRRVQTERLELLRRQNAIADRRLSERLIAIYQSEDAGTLEVVLASSNFTELLDQLAYRKEIGEQDRRIVRQVAASRTNVRIARARTERTRGRVARATKAIAVRTEARRAERDRLLAGQAALASARSDKERTLASVQEGKEVYLNEVTGLQRQSAALGASIRAAQAAAAAAQLAASRAVATESGAPEAGTASDETLTAAVQAPSASGFVWPVSGPVTSTFGWRWGKMHEGIDIAAPAGTPIVAVTSGTVIYATWMDGYGNLVVLDHGGGVSTAYAHQSSIGVGVGQSVVQGQTIGYVGCTGVCFGDHVHFEVRVGGSPVDPLGYL